MNNSKSLEYYINLIYTLNSHYREGVFSIIDYKNGKIITSDEFGVCEIKKDTLYKNRVPTIQSAVDKNEYAIKQFKKVHGDKYLYDKFEYTISINKSVVTCKKHGDFKINHHNHINGRGCKDCKIDNLREFPSGWSNTLWQESSERSPYFDSFKVYIIRCWNEEEEFYKIGKTYNTLSRRFMGFPYEYEVIAEYVFENAKDSSKEEERLKKYNKNNKYTPLKRFKGYSECFSRLNIIKDK
jgi:hypothetical protein